MRSILFFLAFSASAYAEDTDILRVTNGIASQPARLSAVIYQDGCTGTFVSPTTIVTAAHCAGQGFTYKGIRTSSWQSMGEYHGIPFATENDVRVLVFPQAVAPAWMPVVNEAVFPGLHVVLAGFGAYGMMDSPLKDYRFRFGTNFVSGFDSNGRVIRVDGSKRPQVDQQEGNQSSVGPGDSGGPLLWNGRVAGVASGIYGLTPDTQRALYVNLTNPTSLIRKTAGIEFAGWDPATSWLIADVQMAEEPAWGARNDAYGMHFINKMGEGGTVRVLLTEKDLKTSSGPTLQDLSEALVTIYGNDYGVHSPTWISRFTDMARQAASYRKGRILLAGDAAHVHNPVGGQGLNTGVQDAVNLGWKLAQVVKQISPDSLLDTYHAERHPVAARVLRKTLAQIVLRRADERIKAVGETIAELLSMDEPRKRYAAMMSGLDIRYDLGEGHPLLGRRMPDLDLVTANGPLRVFTLLHDARPVLLKLGAIGGFDITPWAQRVLAVDARYAGNWELPVLGQVAAPAAVLIRPDGYVAWVGDGTDTGLREALTRWFGA